MLVVIGGLLVIGLAADVAGRHTPFPRVTLLLLAGLLIGPSGFDVIPGDFISAWFDVLTTVALTMIGFLLGQRVTIGALRAEENAIVALATGKVVGAALAVFIGLLSIGVDMTLALVLAGIAPATAPAATYDVVHEIDAQGPFVDRLLGIVALDDAWTLILFSVLLAAATVGTGADTQSVIMTGMIDVGGAIVFGALMGVPMAYLTGRLSDGEPILAEALAFVFLCAGGANLLGISPILAAMAMGSIVASLATHHQRPFRAIEGIEWPFMVLFFVLAGASLHIEAVAGVGFALLVYLLARATGTVLGIAAAGSLKREPDDVRWWMGPALLPQAGVALGLALVASQRLPEYAEPILTIMLASTVILEVTSPVVTRAVLRRVGAVSRD